MGAEKDKINKIDEYFSNNARNVFALSENIARRLGHGYIGHEHMFLALTQTQHSKYALEILGIDPAKISQEAETLTVIGYKPLDIGLFGLTPRAKKIVELALEGSEDSGRKIGSVDLLISTIELGEGIPALLLEKNGINKDTISPFVKSMLRRVEK